MTKTFTLFWQGCLTFNLVSIFYSKQKLYQDAKLLLKDEQEFIESIAVNYILYIFALQSITDSANNCLMYRILQCPHGIASL